MSIFSLYWSFKNYICYYSLFFYIFLILIFFLDKNLFFDKIIKKN